MPDFENRKDKDGFVCKLTRGERTTLLGFDVDHPEDDFVGFAIEVKNPGEADFIPLRNRLAFSYDQPAGTAVTGARAFPTTEAPIQKFRWIDFPPQGRDGNYRYRVTKMHMPRDNVLTKGTSLQVDIDHAEVTYDGLVDIGFTRNFASSQAYAQTFHNAADIIPAKSEDGIDFVKPDLRAPWGESVYDWLGFEARRLIFDFLDTATADPGVTLDVMAYDLNEPDIIGRLERLGSRLRIIVDDSPPDHNEPTSSESRAFKRFKSSAGGAAVKRTHFSGLQHNKVFIQRRGGVVEKVLCGSTNFTFRGLYIQANNVLVFHSPEVGALFGTMFDLAFVDPSGFRDSPFARTWHLVDHRPGPRFQLCFSPHKNTDLSLSPVGAAIEQATSSVLYSIAFLGQTTKGPTRETLDYLIKKPLFSYGTVDQRGGLQLKKPDGSLGVVDFKFLGANAPEPFASEWSGGKGRNIHNKFVVTDFDLPTAKVFTGSSNLSPSGESKNGDHLIMIEDRKIAAAYAIEAIRIFDHLHFRNRMEEAKSGKAPKRGRRKKPSAATTRRKLQLQKPVAISGAEAGWFDRFYKPDSQALRDRKLFSR